MSRSLTLAHGLTFADLHAHDGLQRIDALFGEHVRAADAALSDRSSAGRAAPDAMGAKPEADLLLALAPHLEDFLADLFGIVPAVRALEARHHELAPLFVVKRQFVQRKAMNAYKADVAATFDGIALRAAVESALGAPFSELAFANAVNAWQQDGTGNAAALDTAMRYAAWAAHTAEGRAAHRGGVLFRAPRKLDFMKLVPLEAETRDGVTAWKLPSDHALRRREGFALTDHGTDLVGGLDQAHYCIWCHEQGKDSCARGLPEKKPALDDVPFKKSPFNVTLAGCPLEERISEFHKLRAEGVPLGALAMICVDNPMVAATGHRICNDCMKSCIYQKQDPVDIPQSETRLLKDVLALPWGFEVYSLLTRWNPLNLRRPLPLPRTGRRVLIVGMGPAGFTLAHHLVNDGHTVVGIDGLKIEPLDPELSGINIRGERVPFAPIHDAASLVEPLDDRLMAGFGGVAEYGITVRWDKNFLKMIRLLLERRDRFAMYGGVRFGGTLDDAGAFELGFDHIALATGAGKPTVLELPNGLANGVRTASDFLMALQLTGAAKRDSIANMQVRLPVVVVGGGLTAIDTATESLAYYPVQVEKFLARYETLVAEQGAGTVEAAWRPAERTVAEEFLAHARALRAERAAAAGEGRPARVAELLHEWGGVTIAYRRRLIDSPSYTLNHEEIEKALEEGIRFAEGVTPLAIDVDENGAAVALEVSLQHTDGDGVWHETGHATLPARTILVAAGTQPNTVLAREDAAHFHLDGKYFRVLDEDGQPVKVVRGLAKPAAPAVLTDVRADGRAVSFFGDLHPSFHGNVVKAMASAKQGYPIVSRMLAKVAPADARSDAAFFAILDRQLRATVERVERLTPTIVEVVVRAPAAAARFAPGQFYRLQNYEALAGVRGDTRLVMEGLALTGAWVDREQGLVSTIVLEMGGSSDLCAQLQPGEPVVLDGPDRQPHRDRAGRDRRAGRRRPRQRRAVLDRAGVPPRRLARPLFRRLQEDERPVQGRRHRGGGRRRRVVQRRGAGIRGRPPAGPCVRRQHRRGDARVCDGRARRTDDRLRRLRPHHRDRFGQDDGGGGARAARRAGAVRQAGAAGDRLDQLADAMHDEGDLRAVPAAASRPATGKVSYVFSCFNQDQPLDSVDFAALDLRLAQNAVQEKLTAQWIARTLREH